MLPSFKSLSSFTSRGEQRGRTRSGSSGNRGRDRIPKYELVKLNSTLKIIRNATTYTLDVTDEQNMVKKTNTVIKKQDFIEYLTDIKVLEYGWKSLPFTLLLLASYVLVLAYHGNISLHLQQFSHVDTLIDAPKFTTVKGELTFPEITRLDEFWDWLDQAFLPTLFKPNRGTLEFGVYNYVAGGFRLQTTRSKEKKCSLTGLDTVYQTLCHPADTTSTDRYETTPSPAPTPVPTLRQLGCIGWAALLKYSTPQREEIAANCAFSCRVCSGSNCTDTANFVDAKGKTCDYWSIAGQSSNTTVTEVFVETAFTATGDKFEVFVPDSLNLEEARFVTTLLRGYGWLDANTKSIQLTFVITNAELSLADAVDLSFNQDRGGTLTPLASQFILFLDPYKVTSPGLWIVDGVYIAMVVALIVSASREMNSHHRNGDLKEVYFRNTWNILTWLLVLLSVGMVLYLPLSVNPTTDDVSTALKDFVAITPDPSFASFSERVREITNKMASASATLSGFRAFVVFQIFLIMFRLFKAFDVQPRLAVVTSTFKSCAVDLIHFGIVCTTIFCCFVCLAMVVFGNSYEDCSTFWPCAFMAMKIVMGETSMFMDLAAIQADVASVWYFLFMFIVVLLLINLLVAIIIGVYLDVKSSIGKQAPTIFDQAGSSVRHFWYSVVRDNKGEVDTSEILTQLCRGEGDLKQTQQLSPENMLTLLGVPEAQALSLIRNGLDAIHDKQKQVKCYTASDTFAFLARLDEEFGDLYYKVTKIEVGLSKQVQTFETIRNRLGEACHHMKMTMDK